LEFASLKSLETEDPYKKTNLRMVFGESRRSADVGAVRRRRRGPNTDRSFCTAQWQSAIDRVEPTLKFVANGDLELGVIDLDADVGFTFE
jgi:hypothetical protein